MVVDLQQCATIKDSDLNLDFKSIINLTQKWEIKSEKERKPERVKEWERERRVREIKNWKYEKLLVW